MPTELVVASKNVDKVGEIEALLKDSAIDFEVVRGLDWPDVDETEETLEGNALLKARAVVAATGLAAIADDTGLEVAALGGAPGVHTARFAGPRATYADNVTHLLAAMEGVEDRSATFRTVVVLVAPGSPHLVAEGRLEGNIARWPRGDFGFGYDPIFEVDGKTLGEMTEREKNSISHRARALRSLIEELRR